MIDALVHGRLAKDPVLKTGASGNPFANFLLLVPTGDSEPCLVSGICFNDVAERLARLRKGDAVSLTGSLKPSQWADKASGEIKHGLNLTASACLSAYDVKKRRAAKATANT